MKFISAFVCALCLTLTPVMSQFQGFRQNSRMPYPLLPIVPMNGPVWMGQNGLMGFPSNMGMMIPQPMWTGGMMTGRFQPWQQPTNWQTPWNNNNNNNNLIPAVNTNNGAGVSTSTTTGQTTDPWKAYQQFSSGMSSVLGGTQSTLGSNPLLSSNGVNNGVPSKNYPWNTFATNQQNGPMMPNNANNGPIVGAGNNMNAVNGGLLNNQFPTSSFPQNGGLTGSMVNGGNTGFGNSQFPVSTFPQNAGLTGNTNGMNNGNGGFPNTQFLSSSAQEKSVLVPQTQGLNLNQFQWP